MSEHYSHLLIPQKPDLAPSGAQLVAFLKALGALGCAPLQPALRISKCSDKVRMGRDPYTGDEISIPIREITEVQSLEIVEQEIAGREDFSVFVTGHGPSAARPFALFAASDPGCESEVTDHYHYEVVCNLRPHGVTFSEESWQAPCSLEQRDAVASNPWTGEQILVTAAGCARFWIEFTFGSWLVPKVTDSFNILTPMIPDLALKEFGVPFAQCGIFL